MPLFKRKTGQIFNSWFPRLKSSNESSDRKSVEEPHSSSEQVNVSTPNHSQQNIGGARGIVNVTTAYNGDLGESCSSLGRGALGHQRPRSLILNADFMQELDGDMGVSARTLDSPMRTSSRLSKTLQEILHDKEALPYFLQYMESRGAGRYVRFWLDAKSFQTAAWTRIRTHSLNALAKSSLTEISRNGTQNPNLSSSTSSSSSPHFPLQPSSPPPLTILRATPGVDLSLSSSPEPHQGGSSSSQKFVSEGQQSPGVSPTSSAPVRPVDPSSVSGADPSLSSSPDPKQEVPPSSQNIISDGRLSPGVLPTSSALARPVVPSSFPAALSCTHAPKTSPISSSSSSSLSSPFYASPCGPDPGPPNADNTTGDTNQNPQVTDTTKTPDYENASDSFTSGASLLSAATDCSGGTSDKEEGSAAVEASSGNSDDSSGNGSGEASTGVTPSGVSGHQDSSTNKIKMGQKLLSSIEKDAVTIYSQYISLDATQPIGISDKLRNQTTSKICQEDGKVDPQCFVDCQEYVLERMESDYYPDFLHSVFHCKHQINVLTSGKVYLADILHNDTAIFYFMEFMEQEDAINLFQFWMAAENFQQHLSLSQGCYDGLQAQEDAMVLYDKYFSLQATQPLGFEDKIRLEVESNICREGGPLPDCFAKPKNMVLHVIDKMYFPNFLSGDLYYKYLSELINTVQLANDLPQKTRKRLGSDASSEHSAGSQSTGGAESVSSRNTLLATDTSHLKKALNKMQVDLRIDSVLLNPDALWKRNTPPGRMSFGRINDLGQFVSEYDPEPELEKKKSSMFFRKRKDREKEEENMAAQIAQMIISDVTSITQPSSYSTSQLNLQPPPYSSYEEAS